MGSKMFKAHDLFQCARSWMLQVQQGSNIQVYGRTLCITDSFGFLAYDLLQKDHAWEENYREVEICKKTLGPNRFAKAQQKASQVQCSCCPHSTPLPRIKARITIGHLAVYIIKPFLAKQIFIFTCKTISQIQNGFKDVQSTWLISMRSFMDATSTTGFKHPGLWKNSLHHGFLWIPSIWFATKRPRMGRKLQRGRNM